jgi:plastocyanin
VTRYRRLAVALVAAASTLGAGRISSAPAPGAPFVIQILDAAPFFSPSSAVVKVGQPVEWVNAGSGVHSVSTDRATAANPASIELPKDATPFDSGFIPAGAAFDYTFAVPGIYRYVCIPHERAGASGRITVKK